MEAFRGSALCLLLKNELEAQVPLDQWLTDIKNAIGINPLTDISGVTFYNTSFEENVAVALIHAKVDQQAITKLLQTNPTYNTEKYSDRTLHTWTDRGKSGAGMFYGDDLVVIGDKAATVKAAVDVLDGRKPGGAAIVKDAVPGQFAVIGATGLKALADRPNSQMLAQAESLQVNLVEKDGKVKAML